MEKESRQIRFLTDISKCGRYQPLVGRTKKNILPPIAPAHDTGPAFLSGEALVKTEASSEDG
jgi:hypothetical protein